VRKSVNPQENKELTNNFVRHLTASRIASDERSGANDLQTGQLDSFQLIGNPRYQKARTCARRTSAGLQIRYFKKTNVRAISDPPMQ